MRGKVVSGRVRIALAVVVLACALAFSFQVREARADDMSGYSVAAGQVSAQGLAQQASAAPDLDLYDIDGSAAKTLNGTFGKQYRVVIVGRPSCPYTRSVVDKALELSEQGAYKNIKFIVLDCDGDFNVFKKGFSSKETSRVRFYSSGENNSWAYNSWAWQCYRASHGDQVDSVTLPFLFLIDKKGNYTDWTDNTRLAQAIYDSFGIKGKSYSPFLGLASKVRVGKVLHADYCGFGSGDVTWKSSNGAVASVSQKGVVKGKKSGKVKITATSKSGVSASVEVEVYGKPVSISVKGKSLAKDAYSMLPLVNKARAKAGAKSLKWDSRLEKCALKRAAGLAVYPNEALPTREYVSTLADWSSGYLDELFHLTASNAKSVVSDWAQDSYNPWTMNYTGFKSFGAACFVNQDGSYHWVALFSVDDPNGKRASTSNGSRSVVFDMASNDVAIQPSARTKTLVLGSTKSFTMKLLVSDKNVDPQGWSIRSGWTRSYGWGSERTGKALVSPSTATWRSSNTSVATVDSTGKVTAKRMGVATITASVAGKSVKCKVAVKRSLSKATVTGLSSKKYTGKAQKPGFVIKLAGKTLKKNRDFTVKYSNNKKIGTAQVVITGKGNYSGKLQRTFRIV